MVVPIDLRSSHVFAQWLRLIAGAYILAINRHARLLHFLVSVNDHNCGVAVFRRFSTRYFGICQFFLLYCGIGYPPSPPNALLHYDYFNSLTLSNVGELSGS